MIKTLIKCCLLITMCFFKGFGQTNGNLNDVQQNFSLSILPATDKITIDGNLTEATWASASAATDFWLKYPIDNKKASKQTLVKMAYDETFVYLSAVCYDTSYYIIQSLKRDQQNFWANDAFGVFIDPVNQKSTGFVFVVSAFNVQSEGLSSASGRDGPNFSWDNKWFSATKRYDDRWIVEMAIPFKTLRFNPDNTVWGINFLRAYPKKNEVHSWTKMPINFMPFDFGYTGALIWDNPLKNPGKNISVIPYTTGNVTTGNENNNAVKGSFNAGFDAKVAVSSSLNLDLTVNPDFSQVEVDRQVTNLTRFSIFFPERRNFFLENDDLFSQFGNPLVRPFYSRRIGLDDDANKIPIIAGARLTGNLDKNWRMGLLNMQTAAQNEFAAQNYTAVSFNRRLLKRSSINGYFLNRNAFLSAIEKQKDPMKEFGRNAGLDARFTNQKGTVNFWGKYNLSFKPDIDKDRSFFMAGGRYNGRKFSGFMSFSQVNTHYYADMGFIERILNYDAANDTTIRLGYKMLFQRSEYSIFPKKGKINQHEFELGNFYVWNPDNSLNERRQELEYSINFKNTSSIEVSYSIQKTILLFASRFTNGDPLPPGAYNYNQLEAEFSSDNRKTLFFEGSIKTGNFFNGTIQQYVAGVTLRKQPWGNFTMNFEKNILKFPAPYGNTDLFLISPRVEINFSNSIFWTTFFQYNTQRNNFNINSRFQWRFKPMSDLFLVYTDNYFSDPFLKNKNRALVFKLNYWLNI